MALTQHAAAAKDAKGGDATVFQHRHYAFVARVLSELSTTERANMASLFANAFQKNPRFNRARFMTACKVLVE